MNRSFRAQESQMQMSMKQRHEVSSLRTSMMKEKEEELALFLEMRKREKERNNLLLQNSEEFDAPPGSKPGSPPIYNITSSTFARKTGADDFLNSDNDKNDYDWLLTPPGTPLFPSLEMESQRTVMSQIGTPKARPTVLKSRLADPQPEPAVRSNLASRQPASSPGLNSSNAGIRRPSSSGGPGSRPATPTGRSTLSSTSKPMLTTASKPTLTAVSKPSLTNASKPSRSSTPTSRSTLPVSKPTVPARSSTPSRNTARSSTPLSRTSARSSTPTARPSSIPASKPTSRAATPTRRPAALSTVTNTSTVLVRSPSSTSSIPASKPTSRAATPTRRPAALSTVTNTSTVLVKSPSTSVTRSGPTTSRNPVPPRGSSPTVKSRPWKPSEMPGFSLDAPPNLRTSLPERPLSATRGRPGAPSGRSSSVEAGSTGRGRRQSCSPSRGRPSNGIIHSSGSSVPAMSRAHSKANDNVSPVLIGTKMVERVINMRKLAPPKQDDKHSPQGNLSGKSSSPDSSGFGRTLSKKSLDMAIRHMDIRRSIPSNLRPLMTNIPASSMYSVRSGPGPARSRSRTVSVSDSPLATSSNASSEVSVNNNALCLEGSEVGDDINSEKVVRSPVGVQCR